VTTPVPGPPASVLATIIRADPAHPYDPATQARRATFGAVNLPDLPSLMTDVVFMPQFALLDANGTWTGYLSTQGLPGAVAASRYVGATTSGSPGTGTFTVGDWVIDQTGRVWVCTVAGSPGTWVGASGSGFANPMTTLGDLISGGVSGTAARLAGNTTSTREFLTSTGSGGLATTPAWAVIAATDLPAATTGAQGAVQLAGDLGGTAVSPQVTGTHLASALPIAQGGTGQAAQQAAIDALAGSQTSAQYLRGNGTHVQMSAIQAGDVPQLADYAPTGLTGATAASRYVGATTTGAPVSGTFAVGDFAIAQDGNAWICTVAGTPGTWLNAANLYLPLAGGTLTGSLTVGGSITSTGLTDIQASGNLKAAFGNLDIQSAGSGVQVKEGANAKQGTVALVTGSKVVSNTSVTASSRIFLTSQADGGTPGWLRVSARTAGTSFTITSSSGTDTSTVAYEIFEPG